MDPAQVIELNALARQKPDAVTAPCSAPSPRHGAVHGAPRRISEEILRHGTVVQVCLDKKFGDLVHYWTLYKLFIIVLLYDYLRTKQPQFADRIICVEGNVADIRLGLSDHDWNWNRIAKEVNFIFHVAATIRFDEPLRNATFTNVRSTREALELARNCKNLKKFVHISTAFSYATEDRLDKDLLEQFYPCPIPPQVMISMAEEVDENRLNNMTNSLLRGWPNTYTFTKSLAEELIRTTAGDLPVCIVRPPLVLPAYHEPAPGWLDVNTLNGPSGIYLGAALGVIHIFHADVNSVISIAPVDFVNNVAIAAAWDSTERKRNGETGITIYNITRSLRFGLIRETMRKENKKLSTPKSVWKADAIEVKNKYIYTTLAWFLHYLPAYVMDSLCLLTGEKPKGISSFVDLYTKLDKLCELYCYFIFNKWNFKDDNVKSMTKRMGDADRAIFNCDLENIDLKDYIEVWTIGLRKYILKDELRGTSQAYRMQQLFFVLNLIVVAIYISILGWICASVFSLGKYILL